MLPWGHLAVGYLSYSLGVRLRYGSPPEGPAVLALIIGTQLPDLIDKPLAWTFGILPSGRSLGHSLLFAILLGGGVWIVMQRYNWNTEAIAFFIGHLSHVIVDVLPAVRDGMWERLHSILWPIFPVYEYSGELDRGIFEFLFALDLTSLPVTGTVLSVISLGFWIYDGKPGIKTFLSVFARRTA